MSGSLEIQTIGQLYIAIGAGGLCVVAFVASYFLCLKKIEKSVDTMALNAATQAEVIKNNTAAIHEFSRSNDNVASAISMIDATIKGFNAILEKHDARSEVVERTVNKIDERTVACVIQQRQG